MIYLLLLAYVGSIFLNRWIYKKALIKRVEGDGYEIIIATWFVPIIGTLFMIILFAVSYLNKKGFGSWFTGKHW